MLRIGLLNDGQNSQFWGIDHIRLIQHLLRTYEEHQPEIIVKNIYVNVVVDSEGVESNEEQQKFLHFMTKQGYNVVKRLYREGQRVDMDAQIGSDLRKYSQDCDLLVLIAGDGDFLPVLNDLTKECGQMSLIITRSEDTSTDIKKIEKMMYSNIKVQFLDDIGIYKDKIIEED